VKDKSIRVLHVEDNKVVADAVRDTLETEGWQVETYADGAVALTKIAGQTHYDLLLLDYDLPNVSGIELVQQARNLAHRRDTPIIVLSAALGEAEARKAGANEFLRKPEDIRSLVGTITHMLDSAKQ
jgi:two-component system response regulator QseB